MSSWVVIGIDSATEAAKTGLARAEYDDGDLVLTDVALGTNPGSVPVTIKEWVGRSTHALLALDRPGRARSGAGGKGPSLFSLVVLYAIHAKS